MCECAKMIVLSVWYDGLKKKNWGCGRIWSLSYANSIYRQIWAVALVDIPEKWYCNCSDLLQFCLQWAELLIKPWSESSSNSSSFFSWYLPLPQFSGQLFFLFKKLCWCAIIFLLLFFPHSSNVWTCESERREFLPLTTRKDNSCSFSKKKQTELMKNNGELQKSFSCRQQE